MIATKVGTFGGPRKKSERAQCDATISAEVDQIMLAKHLH
jgi:hypothetical protein